MLFVFVNRYGEHKSDQKFFKKSVCFPDFSNTVKQELPKYKIQKGKRDQNYGPARRGVFRWGEVAAVVSLEIPALLESVICSDFGRPRKFQDPLLIPTVKNSNLVVTLLSPRTRHLIKLYTQRKLFPQFPSVPRIFQNL